MSDKTIELNRRRVLGGMITLGGAAAAAGAGTFAFFSDTQTSTNNEITAGTLDLNDGIDSTTITISNAAPGDSAYVAFELTNSGSLNGTITNVRVGDNSGSTFDTSTLRTDSDGTPSEFETNGTDDAGELDDALDVGAFIDTQSNFAGTVGVHKNDSVTPSGTEVIAPDTPLSNAPGDYQLSVSLSQTDTKILAFNIDFPDSGSAQNEAQGDTAAFDVQIELQQS